MVWKAARNFLDSHVGEEIPESFSYPQILAPCQTRRRDDEKTHEKMCCVFRGIRICQSENVDEDGIMAYRYEEDLEDHPKFRP